MHSWWCRQDGVGTVLAVLVCGCVFLGSVCGFRLGRQAAWRPRCNRGGVVKRLVALCSLLVVIACSWALYEGSCSVVKLLGGRGAIVVVSS